MDICFLRGLFKGLEPPVTVPFSDSFRTPSTRPIGINPHHVCLSPARHSGGHQRRFRALHENSRHYINQAVQVREMFHYSIHTGVSNPLGLFVVIRAVPLRSTNPETSRCIIAEWYVRPQTTPYTLLDMELHHWINQHSGSSERGR